MSQLAMAEMDVTSDAPLLGGYSFEITAKDIDHLESIRAIVPGGTIVSITYLPNETDAMRIAAARMVRSIGLTPVPHIAARRLSSAAELDRFLSAVVDEAGVDRLFVIAGDLKTPIGPFADALSVIEGVRLGDLGIRTVGFAGYPEGHPDIPADLLDRAIRVKTERLAAQGLAGEVMTQFAFDAEPMVAWLARLRAEGIHHQVRLGLPGPANVGTLLRFARRCGVGASTKVMAKYGASVTKLLTTAGPDRLYSELRGMIRRDIHGPVALHLYPFGGLAKMAEWAAKASSREPA